MLFGINAAPALRPRPTGTERYTFEIIRYLLADPRASGHRWRLYAPEPFDTQLFLPEDAPDALRATVESRVLPQARLWTHRRLAQEVAAHPVDALFVPAHVLPVAVWPRRLPPSVVTLHDVGFRYFPEAHSPRQRRYLDWSTHYSCDHATRIVAVSASTAGDLVRIYHADPARIRVVHEAAAPTPRCDEETIAAVRRQFGLARPYALFLGTIQPRKNLVRLIQAYARLLAHNAADLDLVIGGAAGWLSESVLHEPQRLGIAERVRFLGYVSEAQRAPLLHGARVFCYPSLFEGFGLPILEAQGAGVPVLTATNTSLPEVAGDAALLVDPLDVDALADAMLRLSRDEELRQQLIALGYANIKRFSWEKAARETLDILEEAAASGHPR